MKFSGVSSEAQKVLSREIDRLKDAYNYNSLPKSQRKTIDARIHKEWQIWSKEVLSQEVYGELMENRVCDLCNGRNGNGKLLKVQKTPSHIIHVCSTCVDDYKYNPVVI